MRNDLDRFISAYVECALWSSNDESTESGGEPMDRNYGPDNVHPDTLATMRADCERFIEVHSEDIETGCLTRLDSYEQAGHDFWLTRNGHGCGFWETSDWEEAAGKRLDTASKEAGGYNLCVGEDGMIHGCKG